jgi:alkaline phosphatase
MPKHVKSLAHLSITFLIALSLVAQGFAATESRTSGQSSKEPQRKLRIMPADASAFLVDQRFDIRVEAPSEAAGQLRVLLDGKDVSEWGGRDHLTGKAIDHPPEPPLIGRSVFMSRNWSFATAGRHKLHAEGEAMMPAEVSFEILDWQGTGPKVRNVILLIGDGMGVAQRTAARIAARGLSEGRYRSGMLEMDEMPVSGLVTTSSLSAMVTDSAPGAGSYATGNKGANNELGVFPDNTDNAALKRDDPESNRFWDNPRVENIAEYLHRARGTNLGLVTTADVTDATPAAFAVHTSNRKASTTIADDYFDRRKQTGLTVLMGGGRHWFEPKVEGKKGGRRSSATNPKLDLNRDLVGDFRKDGYVYADSRKSLLDMMGPRPPHILGLFASGDMPVAFDKLGRGAEQITNVPMLDEMSNVAIDSLSSSSPRGFFLMIEGASIDKQIHDEDADRAIWDTIEFDRAVGVAKRFAARTNSDNDPNNDTLVIVTADHETGGFSIIGAKNPDPRIPRGSRDAARPYRGFPDYQDADGDGYPDDADPPSKLIIGFGAGADRYEDWHSNSRPLPPAITKDGKVVANPKRDGPEDADPSSRNGRLITGQIQNGESALIATDLDIEPLIDSVHTATDIALTATGPGAMQFTGVQDNTAIFFKMMRAFGGSYPRVYYDGPKESAR